MAHNLPPAETASQQSPEILAAHDYVFQTIGEKPWILEALIMDIAHKHTVQKTKQTLSVTPTPLGIETKPE